MTIHEAEDKIAELQAALDAAHYDQAFGVWTRPGWEYRATSAAMIIPASYFWTLTESTLPMNATGTK
jgi:hypothetical protein